VNRDRDRMPHREGEGGDGRRDEHCHEPGDAEFRLGDELAEHLPECRVGRDRLLVHAEEREERRGRRGDRPHAGTRRRDVDRWTPCRLIAGERESREHERTDRRRSTEVHEQLGDRQAVAHDFAGVGDGRGIRPAAVGQRREERRQRDRQQHGWAGDAYKPDHPPSLGEVSRENGGAVLPRISRPSRHPSPRSPPSSPCPPAAAWCRACSGSAAWAAAWVRSSSARRGN
jgi:hypothetical protein